MGHNSPDQVAVFHFLRGVSASETAETAETRETPGRDGRRALQSPQAPPRCPIIAPEAFDLIAAAHNTSAPNAGNIESNT